MGHFGGEIMADQPYFFISAFLLNLKLE